MLPHVLFGLALGASSISAPEIDAQVVLAGRLRREAALGAVLARRAALSGRLVRVIDFTAATAARE